MGNSWQLPGALWSTLLGALLALSAVGCAAQRVYTLPNQTALRAQPVAEPMVACATQRNWSAERDGERVRVHFDDRTSTQFDFDAQSNATMAIRVDDGKMTSLQAEHAFGDARQRSDELLACALARGDDEATLAVADAAKDATSTQPVQLPSDQAGALLVASSMGDVVPTDDACATLSACYADIVSVVCHAGDATCRAQYTVQDRNNPAACAQTLNNIPTMLTALQAERQSFEVPSSCSTEAPPTGAAAAQTWQGTWKARLAYRWTCSGGKDQKVHSGEERGSWTVSIAGDAANLKAQVNNAPAGYTLAGQGTEQSLRLCGAFPLRGNGGRTASAKQNNVCFSVDADGDKTQGKAEGAFNTARGKCRISEGRVELIR